MTQPKTPASAIRCGSCGAVGQWRSIKRVTRWHAKTPSVVQARDYDEVAYLELECAACGVITTANPSRIQRS